MEIINPEQYFYVCNGAVLRSLNELVSELHTIDASSFAHHVNEEKNDFSNWVRDVINDKALAKKIENVKNKEEMARIVEKKTNIPVKKNGKVNKKDVISSIKENISNGE